MKRILSFALMLMILFSINLEAKNDNIINKIDKQSFKEKIKAGDVRPELDWNVIYGYPLEIGVTSSGIMNAIYYGLPIYDFEGTNKRSILYLNNVRTEFTPVSISVAPDSMSIISVYEVADMGVTITQTTSYQDGNHQYKMQWDITNNGDAPISNCRWLHGGDIFPMFSGLGDYIDPLNMVATYLLPSAPELSNGKQDIPGPDMSDFPIIGLRGDETTLINSYFQDTPENMDLILNTNNGVLPNTVVNNPEYPVCHYVDWVENELSQGETWTIIGYEKFGIGPINVIPPLDQNVIRGETYSFMFAVENFYSDVFRVENALSKSIQLDGSADLTLDLSASTDNGWNVTVDATISLSPYETDSVEVVVTIPFGADSGEEEIVLIIEGGAEDEIYRESGLYLNIEPKKYYVDIDATGGAKNGTSWADAYTSLTEALESAYSGDTVWIAEGTYKPEGLEELSLSKIRGLTGAPSGPRDESFHIASGVKVYGGFLGNETTLEELENRDFRNNATVLSGDIGTPADTSDNCYHVVYFDHVSDETLLDGVTITDGNGSNSEYGGGIFIDGESSGICNPVISNCNIIQNYANKGGGIYNSAFGGGEASPTFINCQISGNSTVGSYAANGGGISSNAQNSGAVANPKFINCLISGNKAVSAGAFYGFVSQGGSSYPEFINCTIAGNNATYTSTISLYNSIGDNDRSIILRNTIVWGNKNPETQIFGTLDYGDCSIEGVVGDNPWFVNPADTSDAPTIAGDYRLITGSPAIDGGDNANIPNGITTDLDGESRTQGEWVDAGAYEGGEDIPIIYVKRQAVAQELALPKGRTPVSAGQSWADPITNLQDALAAAQPGFQIWVAAGTYYPDEGTGISDGDKDTSFVIPSNIKVYGGFLGNETSIEDRDFRNNVTILCGDIDDNGNEDSYHVVYFDHVNDETVLDGFTITGGYGLETGNYKNGGGIYNDGTGNGLSSNPQILNCIIEDNAASFGGGIYNIGDDHGEANPLIMSCIIRDNYAINYGGGICNDSRSIGSGESSPDIVNSVIANNHGQFRAGAIANLASNNGVVWPTIKSTTISGNMTTTVVGSGIFNKSESNGTSGTTLINSIVWGNMTNSSGNNIAVEGDADYRDIETIFSNIGEDGFAGINNSINEDPNFVANFSDYHLKSGSPCINTATNNEVDFDYDLDGEDRIQDVTVDMGAYEGAETGIIYVDRTPPERVAFAVKDRQPVNAQIAWVNPFSNLQDALAIAQDGDTIWVAEGTYYPDEGTGYTPDDKTASFVIPEGVVLYGGFEGNETSLDQREPFKNIVYLSGNIDDNDDDTGNSYHVVEFNDAGNTSVLDGFMIKEGYAFNLESYYDQGGAGIYIHNSSPKIVNCGLTENKSISVGGALWIKSEGQSGTSSPELKNCTFAFNSCIGQGGAIYINKYASTTCEPVFINCIIAGNHTQTNAGAIFAHNSGTADNSSFKLINCTITGNRANGAVGGIYTSTHNNCAFQIELTNTIVWDNTDGGSHKEIDIYNLCTLTVNNSIVKGGAAGIDADNLISSNLYFNDPQFVVPYNPADAPGVVEADLELKPTSPAINAGIETAETPSEDIVGTDRVNIDIGAIEFDGIPFQRFYVDKNATGNNDGSSWADAYNNLQDALGTAEYGHEIWVAAATYYPYMEELGNAVLGKNSKTMLPSVREYSFEIPSGVAVYGGFDGTETALTERDSIKGNPTILSGEIQQDGDSTNNAYNVVVFEEVDSTTIIDGFIITDGYGMNMQFYPNYAGGGIRISSGSPRIKNCNITGNTSLYGGGIYITSDDDDTNPVIENCVISNNESEHYGGGVYLNFGDYDCLPKFINCLLTGNVTEGSGGAFFVVSDSPDKAVAIILNCTISANYAGSFGGGIACYGMSDDDIGLGVINTILWNNLTEEAPLSNEIQLSGTDLDAQFVNCIIKGGENISNANSEVTFTDIIDSNPLFIDPIDPSLVPSNEGDFHIGYGTPAKDAGLESQGETPEFDLDGVARDTIDIGAYEYAFLGTLASRQLQDFRVEVGEHFINTQIPLRNIFYDSTNANAPIVKTIESIEDSVTARYCCCCCVDTLIFGGIRNDILYLNYFKHADGFGTVTLKAEWAGLTEYVEFDIEVVSVIPGDTINYDGDTTSVALEDELVLPTEFRLSQNYPNPFNPTTMVPFSLPESAPVTLTIYDISGRIVKTLVAGQLNAGYHKFEIDATKFSTGIYFYRLQAGSFTDIKKMTIIK